MNYILFDDSRWSQFLPLTHTRPVSELRCGILTMKTRWEKILSASCSNLTQAYLQEKFPLASGQDNILLNGGIFATAELYNAIEKLQPNEALVQNDLLIACRISGEQLNNNRLPEINSLNTLHWEGSVMQLSNLWDLFSLNDQAIRLDYTLLTAGRTSAPLPEGNQVIGKDLFIEEGAQVYASVINTTSGPVYLAKDSEVMEGSLIRGPFALGEQAVLKMGAKIYGATTIGPGCKVGGEVNNSVFFSNSNKAHDGFIGNAVIGEWCNIGADSNNSNLKNNYEEVKLWSESKKSFVKTGLQFCGLIFGDHSKCGINTMFNTGTVVGVSCNIYGAGFPRNFIPSFSWGSANGFMEYQIHKAIDTASRVFARRKLPFDEVEQRLLQTVFEHTAEQRNY